MHMFQMPHLSSSAEPAPHDLTDAQIDELIAHPYWESLGPQIDALMDQIPPATPRAERTTLLTWIYQRQGVASFEELNGKLTGLATLPKRKKHLRQALRAMEKLLLVSIVNFPRGDADASPADEDMLGKDRLISLTWTGMLWLRRAWSARERLSRNCNLVTVHQNLVDEEEEGGWGDPYWVDNGCRMGPDNDQRHAQPGVETFPAITSIFDLAKLTGSCAEIAITTPEAPVELGAIVGAVPETRADSEQDRHGRNTGCRDITHHEQGPAHCVLAAGERLPPPILRDQWDSRDIQRFLLGARERFGHALCTCPEPLELRIRLRERKCYSAVWPQEHAAHDCECIFFHDEVAQSASQLCAPLCTAPSTRPNDRRDAFIVRIESLGRRLWEAAPLCRWRLQWTRNWGPTRYQLQQAASEFFLNGQPPEQLIFAPRPYHESMGGTLTHAWDAFVRSLPVDSFSLIASDLVHWTGPDPPSNCPYDSLVPFRGFPVAAKRTAVPLC